MEGDLATEELNRRERAKKESIRDLLGEVGPFKGVDLVLPFVVSRYYGYNLTYCYLGQTVLQYMFGVESTFTWYLLPPLVFNRF